MPRTPSPLTHGTTAGYKKRGCRCDLCRAAWSAYNLKYANAWNARNRPARYRLCDQCGTQFSPRANQVRCSSACMRAWRTGNKAARRGAVEVRPIDPVRVYERDNWTCGICELPVDPTIKYPDPGSASLDHIQAISRGGAHAEDNVQCAHLYCNHVKGAHEVAAC